MGVFILKSNPEFRKAMIISFMGHFLFFYCVYFTFSKPIDKTRATVVSFFGSILGKRDLTFRQAIKTNAAAASYKTVFRKQGVVSASQTLNFSHDKPLPSANEALFYTKQLNKFLVIQSKPEPKQAIGQNYFEPPKWEKIELRLKPE